MDRLSSAQRSWNTSRIKSKDTTPELIVRSLLHRNGFRFRVCCGNLPGKPDIVLKKYLAAIQMRGCFWYRHKGCRVTTTSKNNIIFCLEKFEDNVFRDEKNDTLLQESGWQLLILWTCEIADETYIRKLEDSFNVNCNKKLTRKSN